MDKKTGGSSPTDDGEEQVVTTQELKEAAFALRFRLDREELDVVKCWLADMRDKAIKDLGVGGGEYNRLRKSVFEKMKSELGLFEVKRPQACSIARKYEVKPFTGSVWRPKNPRKKN